MRFHARFLLVMFTALALAMGGEARAVAAGMTAGNSLVICSGEGAVTVTLDAQGNVVPPGRMAAHCPDCLASAEGAAPDAVGGIAAPVRFTMAPAAAPQGVAVIVARHMRPQPRGPPTESTT